MKTATILDAALKTVRAAQAEHVPPEEAAHAAITELNRFVQYPSLEIAEWDPALGEHRPLHAQSFPTGLLEALNGEVFLTDLCWPVLHQDSSPKGWADTDRYVDRNSCRLYQEFVLPNGYREGLYVPLFHQERYVGMVTGNTDSSSLPGPEEKEALHTVAPILGEYVFRTRARRTSRSADGAVLLDPELNLLSFEPEHSAETAQLIRRTLVTTWPSRGRISRFALWPENARTPIRVKVEEARSDRGGYYVSWAESALPATLSKRQAEVVTGIVEGMSNTEIGERLFTSPRTVSKHVENILVKLGLPNRSAVTRQAIIEGIYLLDNPALAPASLSS